MAGLLSLFLIWLPIADSSGVDLSLLQKEAEFELTPGVHSYRLPDSFILLDSEYLRIDGTEVDRDAYSVDYSRGVVSLHDIDGSRLRVYYRTLPFSIQPEYCHRRRIHSPGADSMVEEVEIQKPAGLFGEGVRVGGKKTFSVSMGTDDELSLDQSLELRVGGQVRGVAVNGVLSDKNSTVGETSTKSIEELDEMYIEVGTERHKCRVGDYNLKMDGTEFCHLERRLEGVVGEIDLHALDIVAAGAVTRRDFTSNSFVGEDGKQGPYRLTNSQGLHCSHIVSGTEVVYIDGEALEAGKDYTIDYERGTIEFTPRRLITSENRIIVDFQYSNDQFRKKVYGTEISAVAPNQGVEVTAVAFNEKDDLEASSASEKALREASVGEADTFGVWIDGGEWVGDGKGEYVRVEEHYEYVGVGLGDYKVRFTCVGQGKGDYVCPESDRYDWVGEGAGSFLAQIRLQVPEEKSLYDLKVAYRPGSTVSIEYEHAMLRRDLNTVSQADEVSQSQAQSLKLSLEDRSVGWGRLTMSTELWKLGDQFSSSSFVRRKKRWFDGSVMDEGLGRELGARYTLRLLDANISIGDVRSAVGYQRKAQIESTVNPGGFPQAFFKYCTIRREEASATGFENSRTIGVTHKFLSLTPTLSYTLEEKDLEKSMTYRFLVNVIRIGGVSATYEHSRTHRHAESPIAESASRSKELRNSLSLTVDARHTKGEFRYVQRKKSFCESPGEDLAYSLGSLSISSAPTDRVEFSVSSLLTSRRSQEKQFVYTRVDHGDGDYVRDPASGEYYRVESGDYVRELVWTGDLNPVLGLKAEIQSRLRPTTMLTLSSHLLLDKEVRERSELFTLSSGDDMKNAVDNTLEIASGNRTIGLILNHHWQRIFRHMGEQSIEERRGISAFIKGQKRELLIGISEELSTYGFAARVQREERKRRLEATEVLRARPLTFSFLEGLERKRIRFPVHYESSGWLPVVTVFARPSVRYEMSMKGSLESAVKVSFSSSPGGTVPYILQLTDPAGLCYEWMSGVDYWLRDSVNSSVSYSGEKRGNDVQHRFRAEVRGYF